MSTQRLNQNNFYKKFLLFLLISLFFLFITKLSKEYDSTIRYKLNYKDLPANKIEQSPTQEFFLINLKATGFKLLLDKIFTKTLNINADNIKFKQGTTYYLLLSSQKNQIQRQLNSGIRIEGFKQDSVFFDLGMLKTKKVPVILKKDINFETGYDILGGFKITPDSISIIGPNAIIDTLQFIDTEILVKNKVDSSIEETIEIKDFKKQKHLKLSTDKIKLTGKVVKFTEASLDLPFIVINQPKDVIISTFPKTIKIKFSVALSDYNQVTQDSFEIICDYKYTKENNLTYLLPEIKRSPNFISHIRFLPHRIEYIIEK